MITGCFLALMAPALRWDGEPVFPDEVDYYALADVRQIERRGRLVDAISGEHRLAQTENVILQGKGLGTAVRLPVAFVPASMRMTYYVAFKDGDTLGYVEPFQMLPDAKRFSLPDGGWGYCW